MLNDKRLIEDFLPIREISRESAREKSIRQGHISMLHIWWSQNQSSEGLAKGSNRLKILQKTSSKKNS